jgi:hypothetical protein
MGVVLSFYRWQKQESTWNRHHVRTIYRSAYSLCKWLDDNKFYESDRHKHVIYIDKQHEDSNEVSQRDFPPFVINVRYKKYSIGDEFRNKSEYHDLTKGAVEMIRKFNSYLYWAIERSRDKFNFGNVYINDILFSEFDLIFLHLSLTEWLEYIDSIDKDTCPGEEGATSPSAPPIEGK